MAKQEKISRHKAGFSKAMIPYMMILPTFIGLAVFNFFPVFIALFRSLYNWSGSMEFGDPNTVFVGFGNYIEIFRNEIFWQTWKNILFFLVTAIAVNLTFPFICALLLFSLRGERQKYFFRTAFVIPMIIPAIVTFLLWKFLYDVDYGLFSQIAMRLVGRPLDMLGRPETVKWGIRLMGVPWVSGTAFLIYVAGLSAIETSIREAAVIDGANVFRRIVNIDIPLCAAQFQMVFTLTTISEIQDYVKIQSITDGGPGYSSTVPGLFMYNTAFGDGGGAFGKACAVGVTMLIVMSLFSLLSRVLFKKSDAT